MVPQRDQQVIELNIGKNSRTFLGSDKAGDVWGNHNMLGFLDRPLHLTGLGTGTGLWLHYLAPAGATYRVDYLAELNTPTSSLSGAS